MSRPVCSLCEGPRDVARREVSGVELVVCRWCWQKYGPADDPPTLGGLLDGPSS